MRCAVILITCLMAVGVFAENAAAPAADPVLDPPTLHCLGAYWIIKGDDNKNAVVDMTYRKAGEQKWISSMPMLRVEKGAHNGAGMNKDKHRSVLDVPADAWLFAGSVVLLEPDTDYELQLALHDADGGSVTKVLKAHTMAEPTAPKNAPTLHVAPGSGGGSGSASDPFKGLPAALNAAKPGDIILVHAGNYAGAFNINKSGEAGKPIVFRGAGDGEAVLDGGGAEQGVNASGQHDVWFEKLSFCNAKWSMVLHGSANVVIRRCHFYKVNQAVCATMNNKNNMGGFFIADNVLEGQFYKWMDPGPPGAHTNKEWEALWETEWRGVEVAGAGNVVCYNRITNFKDALDVAPSSVTCAMDFHNNDCSNCNDDGIELDYSERNTRCFNNRFTNVFQGISVQPVFGGPVYVFRNVIYNCCEEGFKMHNAPSGAIFYHNTIVKKEEPWMLASAVPVRNTFQRNNLFIGTEGDYALDCDCRMVDCDFDYDAFGGTWKTFSKWNKVKYATLKDVQAEANTGAERHCVVVDPATAFASGLKAPDTRATSFDPAKIDLRLKAGCAAIDAGIALPGFNDGAQGKAPDIGAYELGSDLPHYGPRPEK